MSTPTALALKKMVIYFEILWLLLSISIRSPGYEKNQYLEMITTLCHPH